MKTREERNPGIIRRHGRRLLSLVTALSLLIAIVAMGLRTLDLDEESLGRDYVSLGLGILLYPEGEYARLTNWEGRFADLKSEPWTEYASPDWLSPVIWCGAERHAGTLYWRVGMHLNWVILISLTIPMIWSAIALSHWVRRRRLHNAGCCLRCGYDLRASKETCPECGEPFRTAAKPEKPVHA